MFGNRTTLSTYEIYKLNQSQGYYTMYKSNGNRASVIRNETARHKTEPNVIIPVMLTVTSGVNNYIIIKF